jgi:hypothetical protein
MTARAARPAVGFLQAEVLSKIRGLRQAPHRCYANSRFDEIANRARRKSSPRGRRRGKDKEIVGPVQQKIREFIMWIFLRMFGRKSDRWLYEYSIDW